MHRRHQSSWLTVLAIGSVQARGLAHTVKVDDDVAATLHIEPNHNPQAGKPARTWFLLTKSGGQPIPLERCDCELAVYAEQGDTSTVLRPPLQAIAAEQHQNIPGTDIVFPAPGAYRLELQGKPKAGAEFKPFELSFSVTVATGTASKSQNPIVAVQPVTEKDPDALNVDLVIGFGIATLLTLGTIMIILRRVTRH